MKYEIDTGNVEIRYITGISRCMPGYPHDLDVLYESCMENADGNLFSEAKMENRYGLDQAGISEITSSLENKGYISKNGTRYRITKTPWD